MQPTFFIATAIDYTNGAPHIGHAYEKVLADVLARYHRLKGEEVFFLTGVDQHGQKVQQSAEKEGVAPQQFVDGITLQFRALWEKLDVKYTAWAATTDTLHKDCVRTLLQRLWDEKDPATGESRLIYKSKRGGYYSVRQEQFLTEKERGPDGEFGPEWGQVEFREEENYYFRLEEHKDWLLAFIDKRSAQGRPFVVPDFRVAELRNAVEKLAGDLCISRPKARLSWGIEMPFDPEFVTFVWFDALVNYISFAPGYNPAAGADLTEFRRWLPTLNIIGKDILIPAHGVYWPIILHVLGFADEELPTLVVHGWWNSSGGEKMSKSLGNVIDPNVLADKYSAGAVREYLMIDIATGKDSDFSEERLIGAYNADLANSLGNLLNRSLSMSQRYREGKLRKISLQTMADPGLAGYEPSPEGDWIEPYTASMDACQIHTALGGVLTGLVTARNQFVDKAAPWKLAKNPAQADELDAVLYYLAESLRIIAILISPVLPRAAHGIFDQLNWKGDLAGDDARFRLEDARWGALPDGHQLGAPVPLFPRIDVKPAS